MFRALLYIECPLCVLVRHILRIFYTLTFLAIPVEAPVGIFGVPLEDSINYANVAISLTDENGQNYVYGYVPIVIAKCGVFLKERGK